MLNRYLDIYDMISDGDEDNFEDSEAFKCTDIPSLVNLRLPNDNMINEDKREKLRDYCLKLSLDKPDDVELPTSPCPNCHKHVFDVRSLIKQPRDLLSAHSANTSTTSASSQATLRTTNRAYRLTRATASSKKPTMFTN